MTSSSCDERRSGMDSSQNRDSGTDCLKAGILRTAATATRLKTLKNSTDLWKTADTLRANLKLTSSDYLMPALGAIFLRRIATRFEAAHRQIGIDQASSEIAKRKVLPVDYIALLAPTL